MILLKITHSDLTVIRVECRTEAQACAAATRYLDGYRREVGGKPLTETDMKFFRDESEGWNALQFEGRNEADIVHFAMEEF